MHDPLHSHWTVPQVIAALPELRRLDEGSDLLAFQMAGKGEVYKVTRIKPNAKKKNGK
jgi:hypothetical protein